MHEPDIAQPIRCLVKEARDENKTKGFDTMLDILLRSGTRLNLFLESICEDGYIGRNASVETDKGKKSDDPQDENVTLKVESGLVHVADRSVETIKILAINRHPRNIPAVKQ